MFKNAFQLIMFANEDANGNEDYNDDRMGVRMRIIVTIMNDHVNVYEDDNANDDDDRRRTFLMRRTRERLRER